MKVKKENRYIAEMSEYEYSFLLWLLSELQKNGKVEINDDESKKTVLDLFKSFKQI